MLFKHIIGKEKVSHSLGETINRIDRLKLDGKTIVFTNGCFDLLHLGHIEYLLTASLMGDILVVGVNSDSSIQKLKGTDRPIIDEMQRYHIMASLYFVDIVVPFSSETPYELIKAIKPNVLVKGSDYNEEDIVGYDIVKNNGGIVKTIDTNLSPSEYSTTKIINNILLTQK
jgi:D-glycero-beta-D-manno-heptose 1-phosphate adenylyltransferase